MREVFVIQPVMRKNLSRIFKICLRLPRNYFERGRGKTGKNGKKNEKSGFFYGKRYSGPP
jgi:hypothetical protein